LCAAKFSDRDSALWGISTERDSVIAADKRREGKKNPGHSCRETFRNKVQVNSYKLSQNWGILLFKTTRVNTVFYFKGMPQIAAGQYLLLYKRVFITLSVCHDL